MAAYSMDLRTRVLDDWDAGLKAEDVATKYRVSRAWVHRLVQRRRETGGEIGPRPQTRFRAQALAGPRGTRLRNYTPCSHWQTHTVIAALRIDGVAASAVFDGPIDNASFLAYVEQILVPTLRAGDVVVLDKPRGA